MSESKDPMRTQCCGTEVGTPHPGTVKVCLCGDVRWWLDDSGNLSIEVPLSHLRPVPEGDA